MAAVGTDSPTWHRRVLAASAVVTIALSIGAVSMVDATTAPDDKRTVSPCDDLDGYQPVCSMLSGRPDGWFQS